MTAYNMGDRARRLPAHALCCRSGWSPPVAFNLIDSKVSPLGVIVADYKHAGEVNTGSFLD